MSSGDKMKADYAREDVGKIRAAEDLLAGGVEWWPFHLPSDYPEYSHQAYLFPIYPLLLKHIRTIIRVAGTL